MSQLHFFKINLKKYRPVLVIAGFVGIGLLALLITHAAQPNASIQPEGGTTTATVPCGSTSGASGSCVQFSGSTGPIDCHNPVGYQGLDIPTDVTFTVPTSHVYFVSACDGSDTNTGTDDTHPLQTISKAVQKASAGDTIVLRQGIYRENINDGSGGLHKAVTIQAYPQEKPWVDGSVVAAGWTNGGGNVWSVSSWNPSDQCRDNCGDYNDKGYPADNSLDCARYYVNGKITMLSQRRSSSTADCTGEPTGATIQTCIAGDCHPESTLVDEAFLNGQPLQQVTALSSLTAGTFYVDYGTNKLYVYSTTNPGSTIEASAHGYGLWITAPGVKVLGVGFRHFGSISNSKIDIPHAPISIKSNAPGVTFTNVVALLNAATGIESFSHSNTFTNIIAGYNGWRGVEAHTSDGLVINGGHLTHNNTEHFAIYDTVAVAAGGIKVTQTDGSHIHGVTSETNYGNGMWGDVGSQNAVWTNNIIKDNQKNGIMYEIAYNGLFASNRIINNNVGNFPATAGLKISSSSTVRIINNTFVDNHRNLGIYKELRKDTFGITLQNNIFADSQLGSTLLEATSFFSPRDVKTFFTTFDNNGYFRSTANSPNNLAVLHNAWGDNFTGSYGGISALKSAGYEAHGTEINGGPSIFQDAAGGNYVLLPGVVSQFTGAALPNDVADAIGVPRSTTAIRMGFLK